MEKGIVNNTRIVSFLRRLFTSSPIKLVSIRERRPRNSEKKKKKDTNSYLVPIIRLKFRKLAELFVPLKITLLLNGRARWTFFFLFVTRLAASIRFSESRREKEKKKKEGGEERARGGRAKRGESFIYTRDILFILADTVSLP